MFILFIVFQIEGGLDLEFFHLTCEDWNFYLFLQFILAFIIIQVYLSAASISSFFLFYLILHQLLLEFIWPIFLIFSLPFFISMHLCQLYHSQLEVWLFISISFIFQFDFMVFDWGFRSLLIICWILNLRQQITYFFYFYNISTLLIIKKKNIVMEAKSSTKKLKQNINPSQKNISQSPHQDVQKQLLIDNIKDHQLLSGHQKQEQKQANEQNQKNKQFSFHLTNKIEQKHQISYSKIAEGNEKQSTIKPKTTQRGLEDKIKQNQINIKTQTKKFHNHISHENLESKVFLTKKEKQRLKLYFKHISQRLYTYPKNTTFDEIQNLYTTINMTEWMIFCKNMGLIDKFRHPTYTPIDANGVKLLSYIYKKYQDPDRRMNFTNFLNGVREVILRVASNFSSGQENERNIQQLRKQKITEILEQLCLRSKKKFISKLRQMGIMCSQQVFVIKSSPRTSKLSRSLKSEIKQQDRPTNNQRKSVNTCLASNTPVEKNYPQHHYIGHKIKIYRSNAQRRQSKLMHNLLINNLNKIVPSEETTASLKKFIGSQDKYLKQYFMKEENIRKGVILRLEKTKNKLGNKKHIRI